MSGKRLTGDQRELMLVLIRDGLPSQEIADAVGVSTSIVHYYAVRQGFDRSRKAATKPGEPVEAVAVPPQPTQPRSSLDWQAYALCAGSPGERCGGAETRSYPSRWRYGTLMCGRPTADA